MKQRETLSQQVRSHCIESGKSPRTAKNYYEQIARLCRYLAKRGIAESDVSPEVLTAFLDDELPKASSGRYNTLVAAINYLARHVLNWHRSKFCCDYQKRTSAPTPVHDLKDIRKAILAMPAPYSAIAKIILHTGISLDEVLRIRYADIDLGAQQCLIRSFTGAPARSIPLPFEIIGVIQAQRAHCERLYCQDRLAGVGFASVSKEMKLTIPLEQAAHSLEWQYLFTSEKGLKPCPESHRIVRFPVNDSAFQRKASAAGKRAGVQKLTATSIRYSFAVEMAKKNKPLKLIAHMMGHSDLSTTCKIIAPYVDDPEVYPASMLS